MLSVSSVIFLVIFSISFLIFLKNIKSIIRNINLGKKIDRNNNKKERWKQVFLIAFGQKKMFKKPLVAILHLIVYVGFIVINIEIIEIILDGILDTHRILFSPKWSNIYIALINIFEILAFLVLLACIIFIIRRNILKINRFLNSEMKGWPTIDANLILLFEILLMSAFLTMNAADFALQNSDLSYKYPKVGKFVISGIFSDFLFSGLTSKTIFFIERFCWWFHILGIFGFLNYLVFSKHLHIIFAFPNTYYSNLNILGKYTADAGC